ncbi:MAG: hypothetical protein GX594_14815, partial [Pirellulaceae bacterium]|nr:hypothetical protein [Pirellulaceae bacterium]
LESGYRLARRRFAAWNSILPRSLGLPGALKRLAYNVAWMKIDPLWVAIIRAGLMPAATRIFERILQLDTRAWSGREYKLPGSTIATVGEFEVHDCENLTDLHSPAHVSVGLSNCPDSESVFSQ